MINLRYHIVSITAVFLALAIGIAMGSTFIDKATVDQLKRNIDGVEAKANRVDADNGRLQSQLGAYAQADQVLVTNGLPTLLAGTLAEVPVVLLVGTGVSDATLKQVQSLVVAAGADLEGSLRLDERLKKLAPQSDDAVKLAAVLGVSTTDPQKLLHELGSQLGGLLALLSRPDTRQPASTTTSSSPTSSSPTSTSTTASTPGEGPSFHQVNPPLVQQLIGGGFVDFEPPPGERATVPRLVAPGQRVIVLGAPVSSPPPGSLDVTGGVLIPALTTATRAGGLELVAASSLNDATDTSDPASVRSLFVAPLRADKAVAGRLSTVDDLERPNGLLALIWAVKEAADARYGQYGIGSDATAALPKVGPS